MSKSNLSTRLITAFTAGPLVLLLVFLGPAWAWFLFLMLAAALGASELFGMTHPQDRVAQAACTLLTLGVMVVLWFYNHGLDGRALVSLLLLLPLAGLALTLFRLHDVKTAALRGAAATFGPLYLGGGLTALAMIRRDAGAEGCDGAGFVLLTMFLAWLSDTGGYFAGKRFGKRKLYPAVSPNKTVEGALGGLAGAATGALITHFWVVPSLPILNALALAMVAGALGQVGDLAESMIKRSVGVKDSGGIIPGHGGILDRADALGWQRVLLREVLGILTREDVVRDDGNRVLIAQMAAQLQDQRGLARADRAADAHGEGPLPPVPGGPQVVRARLAHRKGADAVIVAAVPTHATEEAQC